MRSCFISCPASPRAIWEKGSPFSIVFTAFWPRSLRRRPRCRSSILKFKEMPQILSLFSPKPEFSQISEGFSKSYRHGQDCFSLFSSGGVIFSSFSRDPDSPLLFPLPGVVCVCVGFYFPVPKPIYELLKPHTAQADNKRCRPQLSEAGSGKAQQRRPPFPERHRCVLQGMQHFHGGEGSSAGSPQPWRGETAAEARTRHRETSALPLAVASHDIK